MHFITWPVLTIIFKLFTNFKVYGRENIKELKKPAIFASNHESYFDPFIIGMGLTWFSKFHPVYYLINDRLFQTALGKFAKFFYGAFQGKLNRGIEHAMRTPTQLLWNGKSVGIFPEWCYEQKSLVRRMDKLIPLISRECMRPIVPVFLYGVKNISWGRIFTFKKEMAVIFGKPFFINNHLTEEEMTKKVYDSLNNVRMQMFGIIDEKEKKFWNSYGKFYHHLEKAAPYKKLIKDFGDSINEVKGTWVDLGSGSGAIIKILQEKKKDNNVKIIGADFEQNFINTLKQKFKKDDNIDIQELDLSKKNWFEKNSIDGVTANLVLPYLLHHDSHGNLQAFKEVLKKIFEILKPGGKFIFSSPKKGVHFWKVFIAYKKEVFNFKGKNDIYYGFMILKHALRIEKKGRRGIYHFLPVEELNKILTEIGFAGMSYKISMAKQVEVISCKKPL